MKNKLELTWIGKNNQENIEPRILIENKENGAIISQLLVLKEYRNKGIGTKLLNMAIDYFKSFGKTKVAFKYFLPACYPWYIPNTNKKKIIVCDEAWLFLKYQESAEFLVNVARRGRKYNVPLFIGSQFIDEFLSSEERKSYYKYMFY